MICVVRAGIVRPVGRIGQIGRGGELRENGVSIVISQRRGIGDLICPGLIVLDLSAANGPHDLDHFGTGCLGKERLVEARATLLDACKMKASSVSDKLNQEAVVWIRRRGQIRVWNAGDVHQVNDLREVGAEIRIERTPIAKVEARINSKLHQIGQALGGFVRAGCLAAGQGSKLLEADGFVAF